MKHSEFVALVESMRTAQKGFFKSDKNSADRTAFLNQSRALEKQVDDEINKFASNQGELFSDQKTG